MNGLARIVVDLMRNDGGKFTAPNGLEIEFKPEHDGEWHAFTLSNRGCKITSDLCLQFQWAIQEVVNTGVVYMQPFHHGDDLLGWQFLIDASDRLKPEYEEHV